MAASREVAYLSNFKGGLNLTDQVEDIDDNQSPDCLNVDFGLRGGFITRGGFQTQDYAAAWSGMKFLGPTYFGSDVVLCQATDGSLYKWNGSTLTDTAFDITDSTNRVRMAVHSNYAYFANGESGGNLTMTRWDGSSLTTLANGFNDDYTAPVGGDIPLAKHIAHFMGHLFVADTYESAVRKPSRVRFSHLQQPEDWATDDWFDIDPGDIGNPITALVPFQGKLVVFKRTGIYAIYGYDKDSFQWEQISAESGTCGCGASASNSKVLYWFSTAGVLMAWDGRRDAVPVTDGLRWWSDTGKIKHGGDHRLMWAEDRLWMRLEAGANEDVDYWLFIYDPRTGALTRYSPQVADMVNWVKIGANNDPLFVFATDLNLYRWDRAYSYDVVDAGSGGVITPIDAYYKTAWFTAGETATRKRWKRPRISAAADADTTITLGVYHDFDGGSTPGRTSSFFIDAAEGNVWDTMLWGDTWAVESDDVYAFERLSSGGSSFAIQYEFSSNDNLGRWWVNSIAVPFRRKQVK